MLIYSKDEDLEGEPADIEFSNRFCQDWRSPWNDRRTAANHRASFPTKIATFCYARHLRHIRSRFQKLPPKTRVRPTYAIATRAYAAAYAFGSRCFYAPTAFVMYQASTPI